MKTDWLNFSIVTVKGNKYHYLETKHLYSTSTVWFGFVMLCEMQSKAVPQSEEFNPELIQMQNK